MTKAMKKELAYIERLRKNCYRWTARLTFGAVLFAIIIVIFFGGIKGAMRGATSSDYRARIERVESGEISAEEAGTLKEPLYETKEEEETAMTAGLLTALISGFVSVFIFIFLIDAISNYKKAKEDLNTQEFYVKNRIEREERESETFQKTHFVGDEEEEERKENVALRLKRISKRVDGSDMEQPLKRIKKQLKDFDEIQSKLRSLITQYEASYLNDAEISLDNLESQAYDQVEIMLKRRERGEDMSSDVLLGMLDAIITANDEYLRLAEDLYTQSVEMVEKKAASKRQTSAVEVQAWIEVLREEVNQKKQVLENSD